MIGDLYYIISTQQVLADYMPTLSSENLTIVMMMMKMVKISMMKMKYI